MAFGHIYKATCKKERKSVKHWEDEGLRSMFSESFNIETASQVGLVVTISEGESVCLRGNLPSFPSWFTWNGSFQSLSFISIVINCCLKRRFSDTWRTLRGQSMDDVGSKFHRDERFYCKIDLRTLTRVDRKKRFEASFLFFWMTITLDCLLCVVNKWQHFNNIDSNEKIVPCQPAKKLSSSVTRKRNVIFILSKLNTGSVIVWGVPMKTQRTRAKESQLFPFFHSLLSPPARLLF